MVSLMRCGSKDAFKTSFAPVLSELWIFRIHSEFTQYWTNRQNERALTTNRRLLSFQIHQRIEGYCSNERATALLSFSSFREYQVYFSSTLSTYTSQVYLGGIDMSAGTVAAENPFGGSKKSRPVRHNVRIDRTWSAAPSFYITSPLPELSIFRVG